VTTSLSIDAGHPEQFAGAVDVADTPVEFAEAVLRLLREPDIRRQRATRALEAFKENFSFEAAFGELVNYLGL
jgi:glycosyltransferase involved in cell wall biosynthesis